MYKNDTDHDILNIKIDWLEKIENLLEEELKWQT